MNDYERLERRVDEFLNGFRFDTEECGEHGIEIYCDYRDELSDTTLKKLMDSDDPAQELDDMFSERADEYAREYGEQELLDGIKTGISEEFEEIWDEHEEEIWDHIREYGIYWYYPKDRFNREVNVVLMLDTGNANTDFTCDNVLNWTGTYMGESEGNFQEESSVLWLARQQGYEEELKKVTKALFFDGQEDESLPARVGFHSLDALYDALLNDVKKLPAADTQFGRERGTIAGTREWAESRIKTAKKKLKEKELEDSLQRWYGYLHDGEKALITPYSDFTRSCIEELENLPSHMGSMTFLVKMNLFTLLSLRKKIQEKEEGSVTLGKNVMCGLYDAWSGGGSILEVRPEKNVVIPFSVIHDIWIDGTKQHGYDPGDVYGLCGSAWKDCLLRIDGPADGVCLAA